MTSPEQDRRNRLATLRAALAKKHEALETNQRIILSETVGRMMITWGSKEKTILDYLRTLEMANFVRLDQAADVIYWLGDSQK